MSMEPLKPLEAVPVTHGIKMVKIDPSAKYIVFATNDIDIISFISDVANPLPVGTPVYVVEDIDRAIKIYELFDTRVNHGN